MLVIIGESVAWLFIDLDKFEDTLFCLDVIILRRIRIIALFYTFFLSYQFFSFD